MPPPCHLPALSPCSPCAEHAAGGTARPPPAPQHPRVPQGPRVPPTSTDRRGLARCWAEGSAGSGSAKDALLLMGSGRGAPAGAGWALGLRFFLLSSILEGFPELRGRHPRRMDARLLAAGGFFVLTPPARRLGGARWAAAGLGGLQQSSGGCSGAPEVVVGLGGLQRGSAAAGGPRPGALPALAGIRGRAGAALSRAVPQHQGAGQRLGPEKQPGSSQPGITSQRHLPEPEQKRKEDFSPSGAGRDPGCPKGELELRAPQGPDTPRALPGIFRPPPKLLLDPRRWWDGAAGAPRVVAGSGCFPQPPAAGRGRGHRPVPGPPSSVPGRPSEPPGRLPSPGAGICI